LKDLIVKTYSPASTQTSSSDDNLENEAEYIPSDISETSNAGNSVLRDIIVQELRQRDLERPTIN